ncbi:MAG: hypothetical protein ACM3SY_04125 [Candidatus Omnitrophota bacterium]
MDEREAISLVSSLANSKYYFLEWALIIGEENRYRLVVVKSKKLVVDEFYSTLRGAKIAFSKIFHHRLSGYSAIRHKPAWSFFYKPDSQWFKGVLDNPYKPIIKIRKERRKKVDIHS